MSGYIGMEKVFYELQLKSFESLCMDFFFSFCVVLGAEDVILSKSFDSQKLEDTEAVSIPAVREDARNEGVGNLKPILFGEYEE